MLSDRFVGRICLATLTVLYLYYTLWTLLTPLLPDSSPIQTWFPDREWAVKLPSLLLLGGFSGVGVLTGWVLIEMARGKQIRHDEKGRGRLRGTAAKQKKKIG
ncbi:hypothetical protein JCM16303_004420 [Sporobolomyces ruberrimus]